VRNETRDRISVFFFAAEPFACSSCKFLCRAMAAARLKKEPVMFQVAVYACQLQMADRVRAKPPSARTVAKHVGLFAAPTTSMNAAQKNSSGAAHVLRVAVLDAGGASWGRRTPASASESQGEDAQAFVEASATREGARQARRLSDGALGWVRTLRCCAACVVRPA